MSRNGVSDSEGCTSKVLVTCQPKAFQKGVDAA